MARRTHLLLHGKVQGVGFRWFAREQARRCNLAGWVRNNADGTVEVCASGEEECIARLESALAAGPTGARVDRVEAVERSAQGAELPYPFQMVR